MLSTTPHALRLPDACPCLDARPALIEQEGSFLGVCLSASMSTVGLAAMTIRPPEDPVHVLHLSADIMQKRPLYLNIVK